MALQTLLLLLRHEEPIRAVIHTTCLMKEVVLGALCAESILVTHGAVHGAGLTLILR